MGKKYYNLTEKPNEGVEDEAPEWMKKVLDIKKENENKKEENPLEKIDDPLLNPNAKVKKSTCSKCGNPLSESEINKCSNCINKK
jgi:predicted Zn-ribbon and HTH transcriptional regulator